MEHLIHSRPIVLIIGAGPAGLTAALSLLQQDLAQPILLESEPIPGGLSRTETYNGHLIDLGGHRFYTRHTEIRQLWEEIMPSQTQVGLPEPEMLTRPRVSRIYFQGHFFDYPLSLSLKTIQQLGLLQAAQIVLSYLQALIRPRAVHSLEDFYINRFGRMLYGLFFEDYTQKLWGRHPREIAPDWGAQRVRGLSLSKVLLSALLNPFGHLRTTETSLIETFHYPRRGPGQFWQQMADEIIRLGGVIHYQTTVRSIQTSCDPAQTAFTVVADTPTGQTEFNGQALFSSMAIKDLITALDPAPSERIRSLAQALPYRDFITCGVLVRSLRLHSQHKGACVKQALPDNWIYIQDRSVKVGRIQIFNNWSTDLVKDPEHTVWMGLEYFASEGDALWSLSDADFKALAKQELIALHLADAEDVLDQVVFHVKKAYPAYFGAYQHFSELRDYLQTNKALYCIGRNGQHRYNNMDHSMLTALEAVRCYQGLSTQADLWSVHTEQQYSG